VKIVCVILALWCLLLTQMVLSLYDGMDEATRYSGEAKRTLEAHTEAIIQLQELEVKTANLLVMVVKKVEAR